MGSSVPYLNRDKRMRSIWLIEEVFFPCAEEKALRDAPQAPSIDHKVFSHSNFVASPVESGGIDIPRGSAQVIGAVPKEIRAKWRLGILNGKIVAGSRYRLPSLRFSRI